MALIWLAGLAVVWQFADRDLPLDDLCIGQAFAQIRQQEQLA